jgi:hypothetical protein
MYKLHFFNTYYFLKMSAADLVQVLHQLKSNTNRRDFESSLEELRIIHWEEDLWHNKKHKR